MKANLSVEELYWNPRIATFFMREQAYHKIEMFIQEAPFKADALRKIDCYAEDMFDNLSDFEEYLYETPFETIIEDIIN